MKKADWEKQYHYGKHNCLQCKYCEQQVKLHGMKYSCLKKLEAGAGEEIKPSYSCDLWEHGEKQT